MTSQRAIVTATVAASAASVAAANLIDRGLVFAIVVAWA